MAEIFGLDFGTTNTLVAKAAGNDVQVFLDENRPIPSVVWYHGTELVVGRRAKAQLAGLKTGVIGDDIVRSPKLQLGSGRPIYVGGVARDVTDVVAAVIRFARKHAESQGRSRFKLERAVFTIPVALGGAGRRDLRQAALKADVHVWQFVHEPLAALYGYLRMQPDFQARMAALENKLILVVDWGGGTLDLTLCTFVKGALVQILNRGDPKVGGDFLDNALAHWARTEHQKHYGLSGSADEMPGADAKLIDQCERAKIALSDLNVQVRLLNVPNFLRSNGPEKDLELRLTRAQLNELAAPIVAQGLRNIDELLQAARVPDGIISLCLATGGLVQMPYIRERLIERFGLQRVPEVIDTDHLIAKGAAFIAADGLRLELAKPIEVLLAGNTYASVVPTKTPLPLEGHEHPFGRGLYCVDPRDGFANIQFVRPEWPGREQATEPRLSYGNVTVKVDPGAQPLDERIELRGRIDQDLIVTAEVQSTLRDHIQRAEIHDLEFGLAVISAGENSPAAPEDDHTKKKNGEHGNGAITLRSNITDEPNGWHFVPGEIVERYRPTQLDIRGNPSARFNLDVRLQVERQIRERMYYRACKDCGLTTYQMNLKGCDRCQITARPL